jgi:hypothetical protein
LPTQLRSGDAPSASEAEPPPSFWRVRGLSSEEFLLKSLSLSFLSSFFFLQLLQLLSSLLGEDFLLLAFLFSLSNFVLKLFVLLDFSLALLLLLGNFVEELFLLLGLLLLQLLKSLALSQRFLLRQRVAVLSQSESLLASLLSSFL